MEEKAGQTAGFSALVQNAADSGALSVKLPRLGLGQIDPAPVPPRGLSCGSFCNCSAMNHLCGTISVWLEP